MRPDSETGYAVTTLVEQVAAALDDDDLEAWPEFFVEDALYKVVSRENQQLGLPAPLMYYYSRGMMRDRVRALREALTYEPLHWRRLLAAPRLTATAPGTVEVRTTFAAYHTTLEGVTTLFTTGRYDDVVVETPDGPRLRSRIVTMDTFGVQNLIAVPL